MKIILAGKVPSQNQTPPWWVAKQALCPECGCAVELEADDNVTVMRDSNGLPHAEISCPTRGCRSVIWFYP